MSTRSQEEVDFLKRVVHQAKSVSVEKVGRGREPVRGLWLKPHPSSTMPFFVDEQGKVFQAQFAGEFVQDDNGQHPLAQMMQVFPLEGAEAGSTQTEASMILQSVLLYLSQEIRQAQTKGEPGPQELMQEATRLFRTPGY